MKAARKLAGLAIMSLVVSAGVVPAHASNVTITSGSSTVISTANTYIYGDTTFAFSSCTGGCGLYDIVGVKNGRGGTEIEITNTSSTILSTTAKSSTNSSAVFVITAALKTGNRGLSAITNIVSGSAALAANNQYVQSVLSNFTETTTGITVGGTATSTLASNNQVTTLAPMLTATNSVTFKDTLSINAISANGMGTLKLTNVALLLNPAPEPASIAIFGTGLLAVAGVRRRFAHRRQALARYRGLAELTSHTFHTEMI
jgi:hypothetical protein